MYFVGLTDFVKRGVLILADEMPRYKNYHYYHYGDDYYDDNNDDDDGDFGLHAKLYLKYCTAP